MQGKIDYVGCEQAYKPVSPYVVIVKAKIDWLENGYCQLLAEMYAVMMEDEKKQTVLSALTNETFWQFYKLDSDLKWVHQSIPYVR